MTDARSELLATYLERRSELLRFFTLRLRSATAAEDLIHDMYLRIATIDPHTEVRNAAGFLFRLGSNLMLDRLRSERRSSSRDDEWRKAHGVIMGADDVADAPRADDAVAAKQRLAAVIAILDTLPLQSQRVFRMHKLDGLSHSEVALALGISRSAVEKHVMAVLRQLMARLP